jgi:signal transduction histidine kinase
VCSLLEGTELMNDQKEYIDMINTSVNGLLGIVNQILDLSKINANKITLEKNDIDISLYMNSFIKQIKNSIKKNVELLFEIKENVPNIIVSDKNRINQILLNFVTNSIKFTKNGYIKIIVEYVNNEIVFKVIDTGIGISKSQQSNIFQEFYQETQNLYGGTGLGLSICKKIINLMNGKIGFTSEHNFGSIFWFTIPQMCSLTLR